MAVVDLNLPDGDGGVLIDTIRADFPETTALVITAMGTVANAVASIKRGAFDFITKPFDVERIKIAVERAAGFSRRTARKLGA